MNYLGQKRLNDVAVIGQTAEPRELSLNRTQYYVFLFNTDFTFYKLIMWARARAICLFFSIHRFTNTIAKLASFVWSLIRWSPTR